MSKSRKQQHEEVAAQVDDIIDGNDDMEDQNDDDAGSVYDEVDVDVDDEEEEVKESKGNGDEEDEEDDEEDDDDDDTNDDVERRIPKKRNHVYHQIPDSTEIKIIAPENRLTSEYMTIYEYSMIVGTRATHIANGSVLYTDAQGLYDPREIAKKEIAENRCPLLVTRRISSTAVEVWEVNEMIKPQL